MILSGNEIIKQVENGKIKITPFDKKQINPNSYDFRLGSYVKTYKNHILDTKVKQDVISLEIPKEGLELKTDKIYLINTLEKMGSDFYVPIIRAKSSIARMGLFIHVTADLIDIGSYNQWTLQLHAVQPVRIYPGMRIGQVTFWEIKGKVDLYSGKYQNASGPMESFVYKDFEEKNE